MQTHKIFNIPFVREASGMVGGALVALVVYGVYQQASGMVTAYILPKGEVVVSDEVQQMRTEKMETIALRAREILSRDGVTGVH